MSRICALYLIILVATFVSVAQSPNSDQEYIISSQSHYQKGEFDIALKEVNKAIELYPKYVDAYFLRAAIKNKKGISSESLIDYDKIIELEPNNQRIEIVYTNRSSLLLQKGEIDLALQDLDKAVSINPKAAEIYIARAVARLLKGERDGALSDYEKSIEINPKFSAAFLGRGYFRYQNNDFKGALADYNEAIKLQSGYADLYVSRGIVYGLSGDFVGTIANIKKGVALNPKSISDEPRGNFNSPFKELNQFIDKNPNNAKAYIIRGIFRKFEKKEKEAENDFNKAMQINPKLKSEINVIIKEFNNDNKLKN